MGVQEHLQKGTNIEKSVINRILYKKKNKGCSYCLETVYTVEIKDSFHHATLQFNNYLFTHP